MKTEIANRLIEAMESGRFKHCRLRIRIGDCRCAIGVLCELYREETGDGTWEPCQIEPDAFHFYGKDDTWPELAGATRSVMEWSGMKSPTGILESGSPTSWPDDPSLSKANDSADDYSAAIEFLKKHAGEI